MECKGKHLPPERTGELFLEELEILIVELLVPGHTVVSERVGELAID